MLNAFICVISSTSIGSPQTRAFIPYNEIQVYKFLRGLGECHSEFEGMTD
jgi:hypothetical protein